jgi:hypothetical protein
VKFLKCLDGVHTEKGFWITLSEFLKKPKLTLKADSLRAVLIRALFFEIDTYRGKFQIDPQNFPEPWNTAIPPAIATLIMLPSPAVLAADSANYSMHVIPEVVTQATRAYINAHCCAGDATVTGVKNARKNQRLFDMVFNQQSAENLLKKFMREGISFGEGSFHWYVIEAVKAHETLSEMTLETPVWGRAVSKLSEFKGSLGFSQKSKPAEPPESVSTIELKK